VSAIPKTFGKDHVLRSEKNTPIARVVLQSGVEFVPGEPLPVAMLTVSTTQVKKVPGRVFYADGLPYRVPADLSPLKITISGSKILVNNFYLEPVK